MAFDPTKPADNSEIRALELRDQFNGLKTLIDAIPAGPPGPQGEPGPEGPQGPQGEPGSGGVTFPYAGDADFQANVFVQGELAFYDADPGGSSESGIRLDSANDMNGPMLLIRGRQSGSDQYTHKLDLAGYTNTGGMGQDIQHGDQLVFDAAQAIWRPKRGIATQFADLSPLGLTVSDPPTAAEVQTIADRLDLILARLQT